MIDTLYQKFRDWSNGGSVYLISDTHFGDSDCELMDKNWISPEEHMKNISIAHKCDTLIHLGDVGNPEYFTKLKCHKVLIMGNHDESASRFKNYFDEIYEGPLMIAEKIILSHEPLNINWAYNIHGHDHDKRNKGDKYHLNLASNVVNYQVYSLSEIIKSGCLKKINSIHRLTIDKASKK